MNFTAPLDSEHLSMKARSNSKRVGDRRVPEGWRNVQKIRRGRRTHGRASRRPYAGLPHEAITSRWLARPRLRVRVGQRDHKPYRTGHPT